MYSHFHPLCECSRYIRSSGAYRSNKNCRKLEFRRYPLWGRRISFNASFFGSSSLDGTVSGIRPLICDSLNIIWAQKMHHNFIDWPYRTVTRAARLLRCQGKGPSRPFVNVKGYPKNAALILMKNTLERWLLENPGFGLLICGPGGRAPDSETTKYCPLLRKVKISEF